EPEIVVAADVAVRTGRSIAALRRRGTVPVDRRVERAVALSDLTFALPGFFFGQYERRSRGALDRRQRAEIVRALQIGMAIAEPRHPPRYWSLRRSRLARDAHEVS